LIEGNVRLGPTAKRRELRVPGARPEEKDL